MFPLIARILSSVALVLFAFGLLNRRKRSIHMPVMLTAGLIDLVTVIIVEIWARTSSGRGAVEQGVDTLLSGGDLLPEIHIAVSSLCIVSFIVAMVTGLRIRRSPRARTIHKGNFFAFAALRLSSYITSFWM